MSGSTYMKKKRGSSKTRRGGQKTRRRGRRGGGRWSDFKRGAAEKLQKVRTKVMRRSGSTEAEVPSASSPGQLAPSDADVFAGVTDAQLEEVAAKHQQEEETRTAARAESELGDEITTGFETKFMATDDPEELKKGIAAVERALKKAEKARRQRKEEKEDAIETRFRLLIAKLKERQNSPALRGTTIASGVTVRAGTGGGYSKKKRRRSKTRRRGRSKTRQRGGNGCRIGGGSKKRRRTRGRGKGKKRSRGQTRRRTR